MRKTKGLALAVLSVTAFTALATVNFIPEVNAESNNINCDIQSISGAGLDFDMHKDCKFSYTDFENFVQVNKVELSTYSITINIKANYSAIHADSYCYEQISTCQYVDYESSVTDYGTGWNYVVDFDGDARLCSTLGEDVTFTFDNKITTGIILTIPIDYHYWEDDDEGYEEITHGAVTYKIKPLYGANYVYTKYGYSFGHDISDEAIGDRYASYDVIDAYANNETSSLSSNAWGTPFADGPCGYTTLLTTLKGIELAHNYSSDTRYKCPLLGSHMGEVYNDEGDNTFSEFFSEDNITLSDNVYGTVDGEDYVLSNERNYLENTYSELVKLGYHLDKNGSRSFTKNKVGLNEYLTTLKAGNDYRYKVSENEVVYIGSDPSSSSFDREETDDVGYSEIAEYIAKDIPVQFCIYKYSYNFSTKGYDGHAMTAIGAGITTFGVKEVIYDLGSGHGYYAMPINDIDSYWLLDVKYQEKITYTYKMLWWNYTITNWEYVSY